MGITLVFKRLLSSDGSTFRSTSALALCVCEVMDYKPLTSAPAEKKRPSPVRTVKTVVGCSSSSRKAEMVSSMRFPPKELSALGRLNYDGEV